MATDLNATHVSDGVAFPNTAAINSSGPSATDGTETIAVGFNNYQSGRQQALLDYAGLTPTGVAESVNGDRVIMLAEQGVLVASYPELDTKTWIGGNTAAQIAAATAGEKFYRSSDAGGATGDAAGPYLQLPANPTPGFLKQYSITVTNVANNWVTVIAVGIPYQTIDGSWRLIFNVSGTFDANTSYDLNFAGVVWETTASNQQVVTFQTYGVDNVRIYCNTNPTTGTILTRGASVTNGHWSGDILLVSKPTWADDFEIPWGITY